MLVWVMDCVEAHDVSEGLKLMILGNFCCVVVM